MGRQRHPAGNWLAQHHIKFPGLQSSTLQTNSCYLPKKSVLNGHTNIHKMAKKKKKQQQQQQKTKNKVGLGLHFSSAQSFVCLDIFCQKQWSVWLAIKFYVRIHRNIMKGIRVTRAISAFQQDGHCKCDIFGTLTSKDNVVVLIHNCNK